jgi:hypothetical protein
MKYASALTLAAYLQSGETVNAALTFGGCEGATPFMKDFE